MKAVGALHSIEGGGDGGVTDGSISRDLRVVNTLDPVFNHYKPGRARCPSAAGCRCFRDGPPTCRPGLAVRVVTVA
jgi:hypothetical protein